MIDNIIKIINLDIKKPNVSVYCGDYITYYILSTNYWNIGFNAITIDNSKYTICVDLDNENMEVYITNGTSFIQTFEMRLCVD